MFNNQIAVKADVLPLLIFCLSPSDIGSLASPRDCAAGTNLSCDGQSRSLEGRQKSVFDSEMPTGKCHFASAKQMARG